MAEPPCSGQGSEAILKTENAAMEMYRFAALMLGNEAEALSLVENTVATVDVDPSPIHALPKAWFGSAFGWSAGNHASSGPGIVRGFAGRGIRLVPRGRRCGAFRNGAYRAGVGRWTRAAAGLAESVFAGAAGSFCATRGAGQQQCGYGASDQPLREAIHLDSGSGQQPVPASALLAGFFPRPLCAGDPGLAAASRVRPAHFFLRNVLARLDVTFALKSARRNPRASTTLIAGFF